jgi:hypothetical protein
VALAALAGVMSATAPSHAAVLVEIEKSTQTMYVTVNGVTRHQWLVSRIRSSLYFAAHSGANFGFDKDTSKLMILVSFMVQKFARRTRGQVGANF